MVKIKKVIVAKKIIESNDLKQATSEFERFIKAVLSEYSNAEIELVVKSKI